jgi:26S proteasome regulatory subunit N5
MVQETLLFVDQIKDMKIKLELIDTLRTVTEGKIFLEVERARVTHTLAKIKESEGKINEAADILHELQVETFGSMEKREKTEFLLEQMRLCLAKKDLTRTQIISRKISTKFFQDEANQDLKLRFYDMMVQHGLYEDQFLKICNYYKHIYDTPSIQQDASKLNQALHHIVMFVILSPHDNEQSDLLHRTFADPNLNKVPLLK